MREIEFRGQKTSSGMGMRNKWVYGNFEKEIFLRVLF